MFYPDFLLRKTQRMCYDRICKKMHNSRTRMYEQYAKSDVELICYNSTHYKYLYEMLNAKIIDAYQRARFVDGISDESYQ